MTMTPKHIAATLVAVLVLSSGCVDAANNNVSPPDSPIKSNNTLVDTNELVNQLEGAIYGLTAYVLKESKPVIREKMNELFDSIMNTTITRLENKSETNT